MSDILTDFVELAQFAREVGKHPRSVHRWTAERNGLPFVRLGNKRLIHVPTAREWLLKKMRRPNSDRRGRRR